MKTWRLTSGILCCVFSAYLIYRAALLGLAIAITSSNSSIAKNYFALAAFMLTSGVLSIVNRSGSKGGNMMLMILFALSTLTSFLSVVSINDFLFWMIWCGICAVVSIISWIVGYGEKD